MALISTFALFVALFGVRASEYGANREVDCESQCHVGFVGELNKSSQLCFEYQLEFTLSACQRQTDLLNPELAISLSFEFPVHSQMVTKNPFFVDEMVAAMKRLLTASQSFRVISRSDRSVIEMPLQTISVADMQLTDSGFGAVATTRVKLCSAALVPQIYGVCILQPVFKGAGNVLQLVGDTHRTVLPLPDLSSLVTATLDTRHMDSFFGSAARNRKLSTAQPPMSFSEFRSLAEDILYPLRRTHELRRISRRNEAKVGEVVNKDSDEAFSEVLGDLRGDEGRQH